MLHAKIRQSSLIRFRRIYTNSTKDVSIETNSFQHNSKIATVLIHRSPVNCINIPFTLQLTRALKEVESSKKVEAVVIKSSIPGVFSAGLDLNDIYGKPQQHVEFLWKSLQECWLQLYSSKLVTLAYIDGHCFASGMILSGACDYRIGIQGNYKLGITGSRIGLIQPPWVLNMLSEIIGTRKTEHALQVGRTFTPAEALDVGFLCTLCSPEQADTACHEVLRSYLSVSQESRVKMKQFSRGDFMKDFNNQKQEALKVFANYAKRDSVQKNIGKFLKGKHDYF